MKKIVILINLIFLINCGDTKILKPFRIQYAKFDSQSNLPTELAPQNKICEPLISKRFYNVLFYLPLNKYSPEELEKIHSSSSIKYRTVFSPLDLFLTLFGFLTSVIVNTVEIDSCAKPISPKTKTTQPKLAEEYVEAPMLAGYSNYRKNISTIGAKQFYISFLPKQNKFIEGEENKFENFVNLYKTKYSSFKIFLLSHSDDQDFKISSERLKLVKENLVKKGISKDLIFSAIDIGTITSENDKKNKVTHRVDILILD